MKDWHLMSVPLIRAEQLLDFGLHDNEAVSVVVFRDS